jgi:hypothetical protein
MPQQLHPLRRAKQMKRILFVLMITAFITSLVGCEQAQQALDTIDKAKSFKGDIEKKANEVKEKALELIPGRSGGGSGDKEKGSQEQNSKESKKGKND